MHRFLAIVFLILLLPFTLPESQAQNGQTLYQTYCAGCHGFNLEGGLATPLIKEDWVYGRSRGLMMRNVRYGIAGTEMVGWGEVFGR